MTYDIFAINNNNALELNEPQNLCKKHQYRFNRASPVSYRVCIVNNCSRQKKKKKQKQQLMRTQTQSVADTDWIGAHSLSLSLQQATWDNNISIDWSQNYVDIPAQVIPNKARNEAAARVSCVFLTIFGTNITSWRNTVGLLIVWLRAVG